MPTLQAGIECPPSLIPTPLLHRSPLECLMFSLLPLQGLTSLHTTRKFHTTKPWPRQLQRSVPHTLCCRLVCCRLGKLFRFLLLLLLLLLLLFLNSLYRSVNAESGHSWGPLRAV